MERRGEYYLVERVMGLREWKREMASLGCREGLEWRVKKDEK